MLRNLRGINALIDEVDALRRDSRLKEKVDNRIKEFIGVKEKNSSFWFIELAYCLLTAYSSAERAQICVDALCDSEALLNGTLVDLKNILRTHGHRFADRRAEYIFEARRMASTIKKIILGFKKSKEARNWLADNVRGLGWKEASHFLRNVGILDVAIIDRHILSTMKEYGLLQNNGGKHVTKKRYMEYEGTLEEVSNMSNMPLGELDLYLWYRKTGKVLK